MNFLVSSSISPSDFNNQHFVTLGRTLILFAWKLFSYDSLGHLGHFGEDKTKSVLFAPLNKYKKLCKINISYGSLKIKQYSEVPYFGCTLDESLSGESVALNVVSKFSLLKKQILSPQLRQILCNALIQPHLDYAYSVWYPNLDKKVKTKLQTLQNKCVRFCLQLDNKARWNN